jgi:hypothetical protein
MNIFRVLLYSFTVFCVFAMGALLVTILAPHSSNSNQLPGGHESRQSAPSTNGNEESLTSIAPHEQPFVTATSPNGASEPEKPDNRSTQLTNLDSLKNPAMQPSGDNATKPVVQDAPASISSGQDILDAAEFVGYYDRLRKPSAPSSWLWGLYRCWTTATPKHRCIDSGIGQIGCYVKTDDVRSWTVSLSN